MESFVDRMNSIVAEAFEFIKEKVLKEGKVTVVREDEQEGGILEEDIDFFHEAPFVGNYGKYGTYDEYAILSLEAKDGKVIVHTRGRGEVDGDKDFQLEQVESQQLVELADLINKI